MNKRKGKPYWLVIDSYVHISVKNNDVLYYNTYSGKVLEFLARTNGDIILKLTRRLLKPENHRVIRISPKELENPVISDFLRLIREYFMGDLVEAGLSNARPFQAAPPRAKIHFDVKKVRNEPDLSPGKELMSYIFEITIYLNDSCNQQCRECTNFFKQAMWCRKETPRPGKPGGNNLDISILENLIRDIKACQLNSLNFTGGDVSLYPHLDELHQVLESVNFKIRFFFHYLNVGERLKSLEQLKKHNFDIRLLAHFPLEIDQFKKAMEFLSGCGLNVQPVIFLQSDEEFSLLEGLLREFPLESPVLLPYYNMNNLDFFKNNFFVNREDIEARKPGQRLIDGNGTINMDNFGKMTILANGKVYANVMDPALGILGKDTIYDCVYRELIKGWSWFRVRKNVLPCKMCNYNLLCPPLSNYNRVIGCNDLCTIR